MAERKRAPDGSFATVHEGRPLTPDEMRKRNSERKRLKRQANREEHTRKNREWNFRRKYGITLAEYDEMRAAQEYRCAICGGHEDELPRQRGRKTTDGLQYLGSALVVDHCHTSNKVRELLCYQCNYMIGHARESAEILEAGAKYIREVCPLTPG